MLTWRGSVTHNHYGICGNAPTDFCKKKVDALKLICGILGIKEYFLEGKSTLLDSVLFEYEGKWEG